MDMHPAADAPADTIDPERYRLAQQAELQVRFLEVEGRAAKDRAELSAWVQRSDIPGLWCLGRRCWNHISTDRRGFNA